MTLTDLKNHAISAALASIILFGYGRHPTVDAIIVTGVWAMLIFAMLVMVALGVVLLYIRSNDRRYDKDLGPLYKGISEMHKAGIAKVISLLLVAYWMYAFIVHEWTATAVFYTLFVIYTQIFVYATKDLAKDFFLAQLKGEGTVE